MSKTITKSKTQDFFDYAYNRNLTKVKRYQFFDKIFKIKNGSAATINAEKCYIDLLEKIEEIEDTTKENEGEETKKEDAAKILKLQADIFESITNGLCSLIGKENCEYVVNYEDEEENGMGLENLMSIFSEIYLIAKGGNPDDATFRGEKEAK